MGWMLWIQGAGLLLAMLASFINPGSKFRVLDLVRAPVCSDSVAPHFGALASEFMYRAWTQLEELDWSTHPRVDAADWWKSGLLP